MSEFPDSITISSSNGEFTVKVSFHTIEPEEVPKLLISVGHLSAEVGRLITGVMARDPVTIADAIVEIYEEIQEIKKIVES